MHEVLQRLGIEDAHYGAYAGRWIEAPGGREVGSVNPSTGKVLGRVVQASLDDYEARVAAASSTFERWRALPARQRGELVRLCGGALRERKDELGALVTLEMG